MFRLKKGTKILLAEPSAQVSWIIPMGGLSDLDFSLEWRDGLCKFRDDEGREVRVELRNGCPMISKLEGEKILQWLEGFYVHQRRKLAAVKTLIAEQALVDKSCLDLEVAMTLKMKEIFPNCPIKWWWVSSHDCSKCGPPTLDRRCRGVDTNAEESKRRRTWSSTSSRAPTNAFGSNNVPQPPLKFCVLTRIAQCQPVCLTRTSSPTCSRCVPQAVSRP